MRGFVAGHCDNGDAHIRREIVVARSTESDGECRDQKKSIEDRD
jgi:hypothetical protein